MKKIRVFLQNAENFFQKDSMLVYIHAVSLLMSFKTTNELEQQHKKLLQWVYDSIPEW